MAGERFRRIAVAADGSPESEAAVEVAIDLARAFDSELLVVAVAPLPAVVATPTVGMMTPVPAPSTAPRYRQVVDAIVAKAKGAGLTAVSGVCEEGPPVEGILAQVARQQSELLVVGSRGLSAAKRLLIGSVSTELVTHAPCPVLVVRGTTPPP